ncbi:MAG: hypothetical protein KGS72_17085 [Cyanobacteria bacterium REEB67]|nr:hypothetical protein [Cyanobacteria bacterium REEB67]
MQPTFASALNNTGKIMGGSYLSQSALAIALAFIGVGDVHRSRHHYLISALGTGCC